MLGNVQFKDKQCGAASDQEMNKHTHSNSAENQETF